MDQQLSAFSAPGRFYRGNLHTHSTNSDGVYNTEETCARYAREGYDFICLSDHYVGLYGYPISDTRAYRTAGFTTILGAELHTGRIGNGEIWHILAVGLPLDFQPPHAPNFDGAQSGETMPDLARRSAAAGAFVAIAHPQWYNLTLEDARTIDAAHAVEIYNHGCEVECDRGDGTAIWDLLLADGRRLSGCATDDAHFRGPDAFGGWVMVKAESRDPDALLTALKIGNYYSSEGPRLHDVRIQDKKVHINCSPANRIMVLGAGAASKQAFGTDITEASFPLARFKPGGWLRVVVADRFGRRAWSNPSWLG